MQIAGTYRFQAGGPVAMVGQRVLGGVAKWVVGELFAAAAKALASPQPHEEEVQ